MRMTNRTLNKYFHFFLDNIRCKLTSCDSYGHTFLILLQVWILDEVILHVFPNPDVHRKDFTHGSMQFMGISDIYWHCSTTKYSNIAACHEHF